MVRRILVYFLTCLLTVSLFGCDGGNEEARADSEEIKTSTLETIEETANDWALSVFQESLHKFAAETGLMLNREETLIDFRYDPERGSIPNLSSEEALSRYIDTPVLLEGQTIIGEASHEGTQMSVKYNSENKDPSLPTYWPSLFGGNAMGPVDYNIDPRVFAESIDECDTLIISGGFESLREEGYYLGELDRVTITTLVFIIDVHERKILHIESIGSDLGDPKNGINEGRVLGDEREQYILTLILNSQD